MGDDFDTNNGERTKDIMETNPYDMQLQYLRERERQILKSIEAIKSAHPDLLSLDILDVLSTLLSNCRQSYAQAQVLSTIWELQNTWGDY